MKFEDLEAFYEVAKHQSFSKAAASLRTAQSALSRRVARLEHQFGLKLFNRHGRGVRMTAEGQALLDRSDGLMHELGSIESFGRGLSAEPAGKIVVAFTPTSGQILGPLVLQAIQKYPKLTLELKEGFTGAIYDWLSRGLIDVAVFARQAVIATGSRTSGCKRAMPNCDRRDRNMEFVTRVQQA